MSGRSLAELVDRGKKPTAIAAVKLELPNTRLELDASGEGDDALTTRSVTHNGREELTLLELLLRLEGDIRRRLEPIRVTPLQAGSILFLRRHADARVTDSAAALRVRQPTMVEVVKDLVRKRWVTKRRSVQDRRAVCLRLSPQGQVLARRIEDQVRQVSRGWRRTRI